MNGQKTSILYLTSGTFQAEGSGEGRWTLLLSAFCFIRRSYIRCCFYCSGGGKRSTWSQNLPGSKNESRSQASLTYSNVSGGLLSSSPDFLFEVSESTYFLLLIHLAPPFISLAFIPRLSHIFRSIMVDIVDALSQQEYYSGTCLCFFMEVHVC
jgi:hypothetical protein